MGLGDNLRYTLGYRSTLKFVNRIREDLGRDPLDKLLPGIPGDPDFCVVANSVGMNGAYFSGTGTRNSFFVVPERPGLALHTKFWKAPKSVHRFAVDFDKGNLPQLSI